MSRPKNPVRNITVSHFYNESFTTFFFFKVRLLGRVSSLLRGMPWTSGVLPASGTNIINIFAKTEGS